MWSCHVCGHLHLHRKWSVAIGSYWKLWQSRRLSVLSSFRIIKVEMQNLKRSKWALGKVHILTYVILHLWAPWTPQTNDFGLSVGSGIVSIFQFEIVGSHILSNSSFIIIGVEVQDLYKRSKWRFSFYWSDRIFRLGSYLWFLIEHNNGVHILSIFFVTRVFLVFVLVNNKLCQTTQI